MTTEFTPVYRCNGNIIEDGTINSHAGLIIGTRNNIEFFRYDEDVDEKCEQCAWDREELERLREEIRVLRGLPAKEATEMRYQSPLRSHPWDIRCVCKQCMDDIVSLTKFVDKENMRSKSKDEKMWIDIVKAAR